MILTDTHFVRQCTRPATAEQRAVYFEAWRVIEDADGKLTAARMTDTQFPHAQAAQDYITMSTRMRYFVRTYKHKHGEKRTYIVADRLKRDKQGNEDIVARFYEEEHAVEFVRWLNAPAVPAASPLAGEFEEVQTKMNFGYEYLISIISDLLDACATLKQGHLNAFTKLSAMKEHEKASNIVVVFEEEYDERKPGPAIVAALATIDKLQNTGEEDA